MKLRRIGTWTSILILPLGLLLAGYWESPHEVETLKVKLVDLVLVIRVTSEVNNDYYIQLTELVVEQFIGVTAGVGDRIKAG
jgi:hypothetical protein